MWYPKLGIHSALPPPGASHSTADMKLLHAGQLWLSAEAKPQTIVTALLFQREIQKTTLKQEEDQSRTLSCSGREQQDS